MIDELKKVAGVVNEEVNQLSSSGKLAEARKRGDYTERYPRTWIKVHYLLARLGDNGSLNRLLNAYKTDISTYPEVKKTLTSQPIIAQWTSSTNGWPTLKTAIYYADQDKQKLLLRINSLMKGDSAWESDPFLSLRSYLGDKVAIVDQEEPPKKNDNIEERISDLLASQDAAKRAEGLAGTGFNQIERYYEKVIDAALHSSGVEKRAAIYGLSFYGKNISPEVLRTLSSHGELETKLMGIELATRKEPLPYAQLAVNLLIAMADPGNRGADKKLTYKIRSQLTHLTRVLSRFSQGEIPRAIKGALKHQNHVVRFYSARALGMGGNPEAIHLLIPLKKDENRLVRKEVAKALLFLGPEA